MSLILILIPLCLLLAAGFLGAFIWAVRRGQYEDVGTPPLRVLADEEPARGPAALPSSSSRTHEH